MQPLRNAEGIHKHASGECAVTETVGLPWWSKWWCGPQTLPHALRCASTLPHPRPHPQPSLRPTSEPSAAGDDADPLAAVAELNFRELQAELKARGLPAGGKREELAERLAAALADEGAGAGASATGGSSSSSGSGSGNAKAAAGIDLDSALDLLEEVPYAELKALCAEAGLSAAGKKAELQVNVWACVWLVAWGGRERSRAWHLVGSCVLYCSYGVVWCRVGRRWNAVSVTPAGPLHCTRRAHTTSFLFSFLLARSNGLRRLRWPATSTSCRR